MTLHLASVINTAGKGGVMDLNEKITNINKEIKNLNQDVKEFLDANYVEFTPVFKKDHMLVTKAEKLMTDMKNLQEKVNEQIQVKLTGSTKELKHLSDSLKELNLELRISKQLLNINECCNSIKKYIQNKQHLQAAKTLHKMKSLLSEFESDLYSLEIIEPLKTEYLMLDSKVSLDIATLWNQLVHVEDEVSENNKYVLAIEGEGKELQDLIILMDYVDNLNNCLQEFSDKLLELVIKSVICYECSVNVKGKKYIVEILDRAGTPEYKCTLYNLKLLFMFLHDHLSSAEEKNQYFLGKLQPYLLKEFSNILLQNCISKTIPMSSSELKQFVPVTVEITEFEDYLISVGFIPKDERFLSDYVKNVDNLYMKKICQEYLTRARDIMRKDLHDSLNYEPPELLDFPKEIVENYDFDKIDRKLSSVTFQMPKCQISKSVKEVLDLIKEILNEACQNLEDCAIRLFYTSRDIIEMYVGLVPLHHKKFLDTIPQQVALFHNNCMYLAHHLLTLAYKYENTLPAAVRQHNLTYADHVLLLRSIGTEYFLNQMKYQKNIILDILRESGLSSIGQSPKLPQDTEKTLRQCMRQLELLKTVWLNVLPEQVYCRAIGCIMNSMVEDLIAKVTNVEDIPANVAMDLVTLFTVIVKRAPAIFRDPEMIQQYVRKWKKFRELIIILGASLKDIEERWADGKGPIAQEFSADHVRRLIKALFQNTDRRSALLTKIK